MKIETQSLLHLIRACLELSKQGFKTTLLFIEAKKQSFKVGSRYLGNRGNDQHQLKRKLNFTYFIINLFWSLPLFVYNRVQDSPLQFGPQGPQDPSQDPRTSSTIPSRTWFQASRQSTSSIPSLAILTAARDLKQFNVMEMKDLANFLLTFAF